MGGYFMHRAIEKDLLGWKAQPDRLPLLVRGARQVGKTYAVETFGQNNFENTLTINFERQPQYISCFESLEPREILNSIELISGTTITPSRTLLFLDEIQECPRAIMAMRYFKERLPELHLVGAGSLLEFALQDKNFRMPVGRVQSLYVKPLSFMEFMQALGHQKLVTYITTINLKTNVNPAIEEQLHTLLQQYFVIGGMPAVVKKFAADQNWRQCQIVQSSLLTAYRDDFAKYAATSRHKYLQRLLEQAPSMVGQHFQYSKVDPNMQSRDLKLGLENLEYAGIIYRVYQTTASGLPLHAQIKEKKFKLLFLDIGLVNASQMLDAELLQQKDLLLVNRGMLAEQFIGQELLVYKDPYLPQPLYYWEREKKGSMAEVDYVINIGEKILPVEVKSGKTGSLRSLQIFLQEKQQPIGIRFSLKPLSFQNNVLSIPLYMVHELKRLVSLPFEP
jgi:hypothetical protein